MARVDNLSNFLTDVADAIKTKKGESARISAADFDTEILALPSQGVYQTKVVNITTNGSTIVTPDAGFDAIEGLEIITDIPKAQLQTKNYNFTTNQTITLLPDTGFNGFSEISLEINVQQQGDTTYKELFDLATDIFDTGVEDDSETADFTIDDEQICLQRALKILRGGI